MRCDLYHGDCLKLLQNLPDHCVDALISDPPYGVTNLSWDRAIDWNARWCQVHRICKPQAIIALFSQQPFTTDLINSNRKAFRYELIWHKTRAVGWLSANHRPLRAHENILIFARRFLGSIYHPQMEYGHKPYMTTHRKTVPHYGKGQHSLSVSRSLNGERHPRSVLTFATRSYSRGHLSLHPTEKPMSLMEWLVRSYSDPGQVVLDPFMGSGTTGVACLSIGRGFIGIETERDYYTTAQIRLEKVPGHSEE